MAKKYDFDYGFEIGNDTSGIQEQSFEDLGKDFELTENSETQIDWACDGVEEQIESLQEDAMDSSFSQESQQVEGILLEEVVAITDNQQITDQMAQYIVTNDYTAEDLEGLENDPEWQAYNQEFNKIYGIEIDDTLPETEGDSQDYFEELPQERQYDSFEQFVIEKYPDFYESGRFYEQGINEYGFQGTCGPTSQANAVNYLLGTNELTENKVLTLAINNNLCETNGEPSACGGTTTGQFVELYEKVNEQIGDKISVERYDYENALSVEEMAEALDNGSVLNVAVDSAVLWGKDQGFGSGFFGREQVYSDHWITVVGVDRSANGSINGFNVIDSGGGVNYVDVDTYDRMCFGSGGRQVIDPTMIVVSKK